MRCFLPRGWAEAGLLAALLTCGCQHNRCCCSRCHAPCHTSSAAVTAAPSAVSSRPVPDQAVARQPADPAAAPVIHTAAKPAPADTEPVLEPAPSSTGAYPDAQAPTRARFAHDPNYRWLVGTLDYSRIQQAWLLRYVSLEEDDRYGGCVTLVGTAPRMQFKAGQTVRVEGELIDPNSQKLRPAFQVRSIRVEGP